MGSEMCIRDRASSTLVDLFNKRSRTVPEEVIDIDASPSNAVDSTLPIDSTPPTDHHVAADPQLESEVEDEAAGGEDEPAVGLVKPRRFRLDVDHPDFAYFEYKNITVTKEGKPPKPGVPLPLLGLRQSIVYSSAKVLFFWPPLTLTLYATCQRHANVGDLTALTQYTTGRHQVVVLQNIGRNYISRMLTSPVLQHSNMSHIGRNCPAPATYSTLSLIHI